MEVIEPKYSVIVPVYNRPEEVDELLDSLTRQSYKDFEVLVIEDGSSVPCKDVVDNYKRKLNIRYFAKENTGQGFTRNFGFERASGAYFIIFDSDCLIPSHYFAAVDIALKEQKFDLFGGPDKAHDNFTPVQKAISYAMTSPFTTGGIRGRKKQIGPYHPRSFNMGLSRVAWQKSGGFRITRMGEDIEFSIRIIENGFKSGLVENAFVYHKRRTSLRQFYKQLHFFGRARINIARFYPGELKAVHLFPAIFVVAWLIFISSPLIHPLLFYSGLVGFGIYFLLIFLDATFANKSLRVGVLSVAASFVQLFAYGVGFFSEARSGWKDIRRRKKQLAAVA